MKFYTRHMALAVSVLALFSTVSAADLKSDLTAAAKALSEKDSYTWVTTTDMGANARFNIGPTTGKTAKGGFTSIEQSVNDNTLAVLRKGEKGAVKTPDGWKLESELPQPGGGGGGFDPANMAALLGRRMLAAKAPAEEILALIPNLAELKSAEGALVADLTEAGAKEWLARGGRRGGNAPEIKNAKGSAKFWVKDGLLHKSEVKVSGVLTGRDGQERDTQRTLTTEIKEVNKTKPDAPEEIAKKLS